MWHGNRLICIHSVIPITFQVRSPVGFEHSEPWETSGLVGTCHPAAPDMGLNAPTAVNTITRHHNSAACDLLSTYTIDCLCWLQSCRLNRRINEIICTLFSADSTINSLYGCWSFQPAKT